MIEKMLRKELILKDFRVNGNTKESALEAIGEELSRRVAVPKETLVRGLKEREALSTTGFGNGIAIPHTKVEGLTEPFISIIRFQDEIEWEALDEAPVKLCIVLVMPENDEENLHLKVLAKFARKLMNDEFVQTLLGETDSDNLHEYIISKLKGDL